MSGSSSIGGTDVTERRRNLCGDRDLAALQPYQRRPAQRRGHPADQWGCVCPEVDADLFGGQRPRLVSKIATSNQHADHADYWVTFQYPGARARLYTHQSERLEKGSETLVFHDPTRPEAGLLFRNLPGDVTLDREGQPVRSGSVAFFVPPAISVAANWWYVYRHWVV